MAYRKNDGSKCEDRIRTFGNDKKIIPKKVIGYTPRAWQYVIHKYVEENKKEQIVVINTPRQQGKSLMLINMLMMESINNYNRFSMCVSPVLSQSRKLYDEMKESVKHIPIVESCNDTRLEIKFKNKSAIFFKSGEMRNSLRGFTISGLLVIDEAAFIDDDVFYLLLPTTDVNKSNVVIVSTPKFKTGFFWDFYSKGIQGVKNCFTLDLIQDGFKSALSEAKLKLYKEMLPPNQYKSEYLGEFLDNESMLWGDFSSLIFDSKDDKISKLSIGIDWGAGVGKDSTAISVMNEKFEQIYTWDFNTIEAGKQIPKIIKLIKPLMKRVNKIVVEKNSIGAVYSSLLKTELLVNGYKGEYHEFNTSNKSKNELVERLQMLIEAKTIKLLPNKKQQLELSMYEATVNPKTNTISYNAPNGYHDDTVIALMLSILASTKPVKYAISSI